MQLFDLYLMVFWEVPTHESLLTSHNTVLNFDAILAKLEH